MIESQTCNRLTRWAAWIRHLSGAPIGLALLCTGPLSAPAQSPPAAPVTVEVTSAEARPGQQLTIAVTLRTGGLEVAGVQNDLTYPVAVMSLVGCEVNATLGKDLTQFKFSLSGVRAVVLGANIDSIPDGSILYTCTFTVASQPVPGTYRLFNSRVVVSSPSGAALPVVAGQGEIIVSGARPTRTPKPTATPVVPAIALDFPIANPGDRVPVRAALRTAGAVIVATKNDFRVDGSAAHIAQRPDGTPDCSVNPHIGKTATFSFISASCDVRGCTALHASVGPGDPTVPIADGAELYRCEVDVTPDAATGQYPLVAAAVVLIDPAGQPLPDVTGSNGFLFVRPLPPTPTPVVPAVRIDVVPAKAGELVQVAVRLESVGASVAGTQNDIGFDGVFISIVAKSSGRPDCTVNPDIDKAATSFAFRPAGCADSQCVAVRAIVFSTANSDPIADGAVLYTCTVRVASDATEAVHPLVASNVVFSTPEGRQVPGATGRSGAIVVGPHDGHQPHGAPLPPAAATATAAVPPSRTGAPAVTPTAASPRRSDAPVPQAKAAGNSGGCQIARTHASPLACALLLLPLALLMLRRKTRSACAVATERQRPGLLMALLTARNPGLTSEDMRTARRTGPRTGTATREPHARDQRRARA